MVKKAFLDKTYKLGLLMRLPIKAKLKITRHSLLDLLRFYPKLIPISYGNEIGYYFDNNDEIYVFYFSDEYIIHEIYSSTSPIYHLRESLLRLLGILLFLDNAYQVDLQSLSPYLITELSRKEIDSISISGLSNSSQYQVLSKRIISLLNEVETLTAKSEKMQGILTNVIAILIKNDAQNGMLSVKELSAKYRIDENLFLSSLQMLPKLGYKPIMYGSGRFSLVEI